MAAIDYKQKIKDYMNSNEIDTLYKSMLNNLFPELKESEDERIRENIIATIHLYYGEPLEDEAKEMIAWLEKQGNANKEYWRGYREGKQEILDKYAEITGIGSKNAQGKLGEMIKKLKPVNEVLEQKPVELDDTNAKEMFIKALERVEEQNNKGYKLTDCDKNSWWEDFKAYTSCTIAQNNAWSEEDEDILNTIINHFKVDIECTDEDDMVRWLKSLKDRVQPQLKQEWSEEDKKLINDTCHLINTLASGYGEKVTEPITLSGTQMIASIKDRLSALVDNRPQSTWKPTEQQMKVLNEVINFAADHGTMRWNDYIYNVLKGLREQLKKL